MPAVTNTERHLDGVTPWGYGPVTIGLVGDGFDDAGGRDGGYAKNLTDGSGLVSFTLPGNRAGEYYVWTSPDQTQIRFIVPSAGGPYTLQSLKIGGIVLPGVPAASADALAALATTVSGLGAPRTYFYEVESFGTLTGVDDSAVVQAAITASLSGIRAPLRLRPGVTYRAKQLNPTGAYIIAHNSGIKIPDGGTAHNMFVPTGAWRLEGGDFDGNKAATADPGVTTDGCGVYQATTSAGWSGTVDIRDAKFHDFWWQSTNFDNTDSTLHDAVSAPLAAVYLERVQTVNCSHIGQRFTGIQNVKLIKPRNTGMGSHGMRFFLCREVLVEDGYSCDNPSGHGLTSLYCYDFNVMGGHYDRNGTTSGTHDGVVFGGDSTSNVNMPGRFIRVVGATCNNNGNQGLIFDASLAGLNALTADTDYPSGRTVNDPVLVFAQVYGVTANGNGDQGISINSSQGVHMTDVITDHNTGHGIQIASKGCSLTNHRAWYNGQKPLAIQGTANWGDHDIRGEADYHHNTPDDTLTITNPTLGYPSRFGQFVYPRRAVTANTTAKLGETLALDTTGGTFVVTLPEIAFLAPGRIHLKWVAGTVAPTIALTGSDVFNIAGGTTSPTFAFLNHGFTIESDPNNSIWTIVSDDLPLAKLDLRYVPTVVPTPVLSTDAANKAYVDNAVAGLLDLRGNYDASGNAWPSSGGSGTAGAILKGDSWFISVAGTLGSSAVSAGDAIYAKVDTPGTTASNWAILENNLTFTPENVANKDTDGTLAANSDTKYASQKATKTYVDGRRLDQAAAPTADVSLASHKLTNVTDPASAQDAATKAYVDAATAAAVTGNNQTGTTYTFVLADAGKVVEGNNASATTFTIPPNSSVAYPVGTVIEIFQQGAGQITVAGGVGVTLRSPGGRTKLFGQYSSATLRQRATDEWCLEGDIST